MAEEDGPGVDKDLADEARQRRDQARRMKAFFQADMRECYWFAAPLLHRVVSTQSSGEPFRPTDAPELSTQLASEVVDDFTTEAINTYMPETGGWFGMQPSLNPKLDTADAQALAGDIGAVQELVKNLIAESNFHARLPQAFVPDGALGTVAMLIDDVRPGEPIMCMPVPLMELDLNVGPYGDVDDRFITRHTKYRHLPALLGAELMKELPQDIRQRVKEKANDRCELAWGWWRDWTDTDVAWKHVVMLGKTRTLTATTVRGWGSCPLIVGRFNPNPMFPFGNGPLLKALPDLRTMDEATALTLERFEIAAHPPFGYPDDGVVNFEGGIGPGEGVPMRPGSGRDFVKLFFEGDPNIQFIVQNDLEKRIRRAHFADYPEQKGKTPPTASQWLDEMVKSQRRMTTPGASFWKEFCAEAVMRFHFIGKQRGFIPDVKAAGQTISVVPYNPAQRAADLDQVQTAQNFVAFANQAFPQVAQVLFDGMTTLQNVKAKMNDRLVALNDADQMKQAIAQLTGLIQAHGGPVRSTPAPNQDIP